MKIIFVILTAILSSPVYANDLEKILDQANKALLLAVIN